MRSMLEENICNLKYQVRCLYDSSIINNVKVQILTKLELYKELHENMISSLLKAHKSHYRKVKDNILTLNQALMTAREDKKEKLKLTKDELKELISKSFKGIVKRIKECTKVKLQEVKQSLAIIRSILKTNILET